jgi:hypothetical protein
MSHTSTDAKWLFPESFYIWNKARERIPLTAPLPEPGSVVIWGEFVTLPLSRPPCEISDI